MGKIKFKYRYRQGYHSKKWLIEIINGAEFNCDIFMDVIRELSPVIIHSELPNIIVESSLSFCEYFFRIKTNIGMINMEKDSWNFVFINSDNDFCINKISNILENDGRFVKIDVIL